MLSDKFKDALDGIRLNIEAIRTFLKDQDAASLKGDLMRLYATTQALEIISEATRRLPDDLTSRRPEIDWRAVRDAGNLYRHNYSRVVASRIWQRRTSSTISKRWSRGS